MIAIARIAAVLTLRGFGRGLGLVAVRGHGDASGLARRFRLRRCRDVFPGTQRLKIEECNN
jgi:hypothetical protein